MTDRGLQTLQQNRKSVLNMRLADIGLRFVSSKLSITFGAMKYQTRFVRICENSTSASRYNQ